MLMSLFATQYSLPCCKQKYRRTLSLGCRYSYSFTHNQYNKNKTQFLTPIISCSPIELLNDCRTVHERLEEAELALACFAVCS